MRATCNMMRWSEKETLQFARMYISHEALWNVEHPQYRVKYSRERAYGEIIKDFRSKTGILLQNDEVKRKIKNLRSTYSQEVTKILRRSCPEATYRPTIKWFSVWHRCFKDIKNGRLKDVDEADEPDDTIEKDLSESESHDEDNNITQSDPFISPETENEDYIYIVKPEPNVLNIKEEYQKKDSTGKLRRKKLKKANSLIYPESTVRNSIDSVSEVKQKEDEFDIYGKFIASQLRKMELESALRMQLKIHSLMSEARINDMSND